MNRKAFHQLLQRYVEGKCSAEEKRLIDQWYELLDFENDFELEEPEMLEIEERLWMKIKNKSLLKTPSAKVVSFSKAKKWIVAAASILIIIGISYWLGVGITAGNNSIVAKKIEEGFLQFNNPSDTIKEVTLQDNSTVNLQPHSRIAVPRNFEITKREVYLEGEAFFKVSRNAVRPFLVYNSNVVTEVLGTSFDVKETNGKIEVAVSTGTVAVYENSSQVNLNNEQKRKNGVIITPNQKVTYYKDERHFITTLVDDPIPVTQDHTGNQKISFVFDDSPLSKVIDALEKEYGVTIVLNGDNLRNKLFTGDITKQNLYTKLDLICQAIQAQYEIKGTNILIKNK